MTSFQAHVHHAFESPTNSLPNTRRVPGISNAWEYASSSAFNVPSSASAWNPSNASGETSTALTNLARSLEYRKTHGMVPSSIIGANHEKLLRWIRSERMRKLPPEGSSYDKVLVRARLFVERLHSFEAAIQHFAGDSQMATQLAYIYCATLLGLGEENSDALLDLFSFFYRCSTDLDNLLGRAELFAVSRSIKDQVTLALADLVTLVVEITAHFQTSLGDMTSGSVAIDIQSTFAGLIASFRTRCEDVSELIWKHQLSQEGQLEERVTDIKTLRQWLEPEDPVLEHITKYTSQFAQDREESTCLWVTPHLTRFLKGDRRTLAVTGNPGSGKSILATVINDHLQHPIGGVAYQPIFVPINSRIPALATPLAVSKSILSQLFASRIGNVGLYRALSDTYERARKTVNDEQYVDLLWDALKNSLPTTLKGAKETVLIVDGVDESICGQSALLQRLQRATANVNNLKLIVLGAEKQEVFPKQSTVQITPELISDDIAAVVRRMFQPCSAFNRLDAEERDVCVHRIVKAADGSFLWAKLASKAIRDESPSNAQALTKVVGDFVKAKHGINDLVSHRLRSNVPQDGVKIVAWLAMAARPLTIWELSVLLSIQPEKGTVTEPKADPLNLLKPLASLVFYQNNMVYLRHGRIRSAIANILNSDKSLPAIKETQVDLIQRLSLYIKHTVTGKDEPTLDLPSSQLTWSLIERYPLLDFALRYWLSYTKMEFGCTTNQEITTAAKALSPVFPTCPLVPLLEMTVWKRKQTPALLSLHNIQTQLYQEGLGTKDPATLQAVLCQTLFYQTVEGIPLSQASQVFYNAAKICHTVLSVQHVLTMRMTKHFLDFTASQTTTSKTEIMSKRIEMLQVLVECYKVHYGSKSDMVISTLSQLAEHYQSISEVHKVEEITASLQGSTTTSQSGPESTASRRPSDQSLVVQLHGQKDTVEHGTVLTLDETFEDDKATTSSFNLDSLLAKAEKYVREGSIMAAERTYVDIWLQTSKENRLQHSVESELRNIKAVRVYSEFLKAQKRDTEVASVLSSFWEEHGPTMPNSQEVVAQFTAVAKLMRSVGVSSLALDVLKQCSQRTSQESSLHKEIQEYTLSTSQEVIQTASTSTSTMTESNLQEMASSASEFSATAIDTLVKMYMSQHRWKDATKTLKRALQATWPSLFASSTNDVVLPQKHKEHCIELAQQLRDCYRYRRQSVKEENICLRLYRAIRRDRQVGDHLLDHITVALVHLYERTCQTDKLISLHQDILNDYSKKFGEGHPVVLKELWVLAELTRPRAACVDYYQRIFQLLNKQSDTCRPEAFEPLLVVATELVNQERYSDALHPCRILFNTLKHPNINPRLRDETFAKSVYERYVHCLQATHAELHVIHDVTVEYRQACLTTFGMRASITIQATKTLANIAQTSHQYETEAIQLYQTLLEVRSDEADIDYDDIRAILAGITEEQSAQASKTESASTQHISQAITTHSQRLSTIRSSYGWAHETSLSQMEELISLYAKQNDIQTATVLLQGAALEILSSGESSSSSLINAAQSIASGYKTVGQVKGARELIQEIHRQVIARDSTNINFTKVDLTSSKRQSLLFLAQLEYNLREGKEFSLTMNEIYSSLMAEYVYFERFRTEIRSQSSTLQDILAIVSHLQGLLHLRGHKSSETALMEQFTDYFMSSESQKLQLKQRQQATVFLSTIIDHFRTHSSQNFLRSIALACHNRVTELLNAKDHHHHHHHHQSASDLAWTTFKYIQAHDGFSTMATMKLIFKTGLEISAWALQQSRFESRAEQDMIHVSTAITQEILTHCKTKNIDLSQLDGIHLNTLIKTLDKQKDYQNLAWILTALWNKRQESSSPSPPNVGYTLALGRMLVITRYLVGDYTAAIRLAEDIVYNCARVHGPVHPSTVEMTVLLSQMYTSVAQGYQDKADQRELTYQYYKKAAGLHENALRVLVDPSSATDIQEDTDELAAAAAGHSPPSSEPSSPISSPGGSGESSGKRARKHLHLLKLAIERLGNWPKDYSEYEKLNSDLFTAFGEDLRGVEGVDKWNLKQFGAGRAEASDDLIALKSYPRLDLNPLAIAV